MERFNAIPADANHGCTWAIPLQWCKDLLLATGKLLHFKTSLLEQKLKNIHKLCSQQSLQPANSAARFVTDIHLRNKLVWIILCWTLTLTVTAIRLLLESKTDIFHETDATPPKEKFTGAMQAMHMQKHKQPQPVFVYHYANTRIEKVSASPIWPRLRPGGENHCHTLNWYEADIQSNLDIAIWIQLNIKSWNIFLKMCIVLNSISISITISIANNKDPSIGLTKKCSAVNAFCKTKKKCNARNHKLLYVFQERPTFPNHLETCKYRAKTLKMPSCCKREETDADRENKHKWHAKL